jgi:hypothetical protein
MPHRPHKKRRTNPPDRDAHRELRLEDSQEWQTRLDKRPLLRYRTSVPVSDVVKLIEGMQTENLSRRVIFHQKPVEEEKGLRYVFYVEYRVAEQSDKYGTIKWIKKHQIDGAVISGPLHTTIEFRTTMSEWYEPLSLLTFGATTLIPLLVMAALNLFGLFWASFWNVLMILWLVAVGCCIGLWAYATRYPTHNEGMAAVLKQVKAVRLKGKTKKYDEASGET